MTYHLYDLILVKFITSHFVSGKLPPHLISKQYEKEKLQSNERKIFLYIKILENIKEAKTNRCDHIIKKGA